MNTDFLITILDKKRACNERKRAFFANIKAHLDATTYAHYGLFKKAVSAPGKINLIAEIKKASPSAGLIREDFNAAKIAGIYIKNNAAAISVLTEDKYFLGKFSYLSQVCENAPVPVLMKDFIVHEYQIYEGLFYGASAVLLIAAILSDNKLKELLKVAHSLDSRVLAVPSGCLPLRPASSSATMGTPVPSTST